MAEFRNEENLVRGKGSRRGGFSVSGTMNASIRAVLAAAFVYKRILNSSIRVILDKSIYQIGTSFAENYTMPMTIIRGSRDAAQATEKRGPTFTGEVWADPILNNPDEGITIVNVTFTPCARTHWHHHENGQVLEVKAGSGWICDKGGKPQRLNVGDIVWAPPGTTHWHGGTKGSILTHFAISRGKTSWLEPVTEEQYNEAGGADNSTQA